LTHKPKIGLEHLHEFLAKFDLNLENFKQYISSDVTLLNKNDHNIIDFDKIKFNKFKSKLTKIDGNIMTVEEAIFKKFFDNFKALQIKDQ
jgi:hypothetical protein